jgi:hypothetical protein
MLLAAVVLMVACGDNAPTTLRDYAEDFGRALVDKARACAVEQPDKASRYGIDEQNGSKFAARFCDFRDSRDDFMDCDEPFEFDMAACLEDFEAQGCVNVGVPENCPSCGYASVPESCRRMWDGSFHG